MTEPTPLWQTRRFRIAVVAGLVGAVALMLILQNFDTTEVQFLFWRAQAPLAGVIFTSILVGAGLQVAARFVLQRRKKMRQAAQPGPAGESN